MAVLIAILILASPSWQRVREVDDCTIPRRAAAIAVFLFMLLVALISWLDGIVEQDEAVFIYTGHAIVETGELPYVRAFDNTGPFGPWFHAGAIQVGSAIGLGNIDSTRLAYLPIALIVVALLLFLASVISKSWFGIALAGFTLGAIPSFAREILSGPRPKMLVVLFELLFVWAALRRRWWLSGTAIALAALVWQPAGLMVVVGLIAVMAQEKEKRTAAVGPLIGGFILPFVIVVGIYGIAGELLAFWEGFVEWNLIYTPAARQEAGLVTRLTLPLKHLWGSHLIVWPLIVAGLFGLGWSMVKRRRVRICSNSLAEEAITLLNALALTWILWTVIDYQGVVDLFPIFPLAALGLTALAASADLVRRLRTTSCVGLIVLIGVLGLWESLRVDDSIRNTQEATFSEIAGPADRVVSYDQPQVLIFAEQINPSRFFFAVPGLSSHLTDTGNVDDFVETLLADRPDLVGASTEMNPMNPVESSLLAGLHTDYLPRSGPTFDVWMADPLRSP